MKLPVITLMAVMLLLSSCASLKSQPKIENTVVKDKSLTELESNAGNNVVYVHGSTDKEIFCASRGNDFAFTQSGGVSFSGKEGATSVGIGEDTSAGIAALGGINSGVLLSREVMYRTCEFMANLKAIDGLTPDVAQQLFQQALKALLQISTDYKSSTETGQVTETSTSTAPTVN